MDNPERSGCGVDWLSTCGCLAVHSMYLEPDIQSLTLTGKVGRFHIQRNGTMATFAVDPVTGRITTEDADAALDLSAAIMRRRDEKPPKPPKEPRRNQSPGPKPSVAPVAPEPDGKSVLDSFEGPQLKFLSLLRDKNKVTLPEVVAALELKSSRSLTGLMAGISGTLLRLGIKRDDVYAPRGGKKGEVRSYEAGLLLRATRK
jgi:hypothetical protein